MSLVNDVTGETAWHTIAYIPVVRTEKESAAAERARLRRCGMLQRVLYVAFRSAIVASHVGVWLRLGHRTVRCFLRLLMYICDQPEERAVLGFKAERCSFSCSSCMSTVSGLVHEGVLSSVERDVISTLERQHQGFRLRRDRRQRSVRLALEAFGSTNSVMPALASMAGLSTPPYLLFKIVGFDILHVRLLEGPVWTWSRIVMRAALYRNGLCLTVRSLQSRRHPSPHPLDARWNLRRSWTSASPAFSYSVLFACFRTFATTALLSRGLLGQRLWRAMHA